MTEGSLGPADLGAWFEDYLRAYAGWCRGDSYDVAQLLQYYAVPLLLTTDAGAVVATSADEVSGAVAQQIERLRAADYHRTEMLESLTELLNATSALRRAGLVWLRADGSEIARLRVTYVITRGAGGCRISALMVGAP